MVFGVVSLVGSKGQGSKRMTAQYRQDNQKMNKGK